MDFFRSAIAALIATLLLLLIVVVLACIIHYVGFGATYFIVFLLILFGLANLNCNGRKKKCCRRKRRCEKE
jgi:UPF0716 family protein affecting phage T7 exclusion